MALPVLVVLGLVAAVAIAATGSTSSGSGATRRPAESLLDMFFTLGLVAVAAGGLLVLYGLTQRKAIAREMSSGRYRSSLFGWVVLAGVYAAVWYFRPNNLGFTQTDPGIEDPLFPDREPPQPGAEQPPGSAYEPNVSWLALAIVGALVIAAAVAYLSSRRRSRDRPPSDEELAEQLAHALEDTLDDLRAESDARRAIIATYARLERVLAANGVPRRAAETAQEYVVRILRDLALDRAAIERLTELFARAKFSHHEVDEAMKEEAIGALEEIRDELRRRAEEPARAAEAEVVATGVPS